jgi:hypothetical protein
LAPALPGPFFFGRRELDWNSATAPADPAVLHRMVRPRRKEGWLAPPLMPFRLELTLAQVEALIPALPDRKPR